MKNFYSWYKKHITTAIFIGLILGILTGLFFIPFCIIFIFFLSSSFIYICVSWIYLIVSDSFFYLCFENLYFNRTFSFVVF